MFTHFHLEYLLTQPLVLGDIYKFFHAKYRDSVGDRRAYVQSYY